MIELRVADYCCECDEFEPHVDRFHAMNGTHTIVSCEHERRCYEMVRHLKNELKKESKDA